MVPSDTKWPKVSESSLFLFQANGTFIVQPNMTEVRGSCMEPTANLTLVFKEGHITFMFNKVLLIFLMCLKLN